jgi:hypothetical protein
MLLELEELLLETEDEELLDRLELDEEELPRLLLEEEDDLLLLELLLTDPVRTTSSICQAADMLLELDDMLFELLEDDP